MSATSNRECNRVITDIKGQLTSLSLEKFECSGFCDRKWMLSISPVFAKQNLLQICVCDHF